MSSFDIDKFYVSPYDKFMRQYDASHELTASQLKEIEKHQKIAELRDHSIEKDGQEKNLVGFLSMSIWFKSYTLDEINKRSANTLADFLGIRFTDMGDDTLTALMPVTQKIKQPIGIVHGGANVVLAETIASTAANLVIDIEKYYAVGLEININHIRSVREGQIIAKTWPLHLGRTTSVWQIELRNQVGKVTAISRMTASILAR